MLGPYPEAVEADIIRYYPGKSVAQCWQGRMSLRELRVLVTHLPPECATARRMRGTHWTEIEYLLADVADTLRFHRAEWAMSKGAKPPKPKPTPRPKVREQATAAVDHRVVARAAHEHVLALVRPAPEPPVDSPPEPPERG